VKNNAKNSTTSGVVQKMEAFTDVKKALERFLEERGHDQARRRHDAAGSPWGTVEWNTDSLEK
jgi:hypothetical protein